MRLGFSTQEAYFTILGVLPLVRLSATGWSPAPKETKLDSTIFALLTPASVPLGPC